MPEFSYEAISDRGTIVKGTIEAENVELAQSLLAQRGYAPLSVTIRRARAPSLITRLKEFLGKIKPEEIIVFTKQFRSMLRAGVPILRALQVLEAQTENKLLKTAMVHIVEDIRAGLTLYEAMVKHPALFPPLYTSMVRAGEISGTLPEVLERLTYILEHEAKIKNDLRAALQYPKIVVIALSFAFFFLLTFVIPQFVNVFSKVGITLPLPTKIAVGLYQFLKNYWHILLIAVISIIFGLRLYVRTPPGRLIKDTLILKLPLLGPLFQKAALSRFASIFAILYASGVPVISAIEILTGIIGNTAIAREFDRLRQKMEEGQGIAQPLKSARYFTPMVVDMIAIGEESGTIDEMLQVLTAHYDDEVAYAVKGLSDAITPILTVALAVVVGFFALAIFMPMWDLVKMVR